MSERRYTDAIVEWDDPEAFRVYLIPEDGEPVALEKVHMGATTMARLYRATFAANARDFVDMPAQGRDLGWPKEAPAKRAAKACRAELKRIAEGLPGVDDATLGMAAQIGRILAGGKGRGGR